jgi:hypothetical protein
MERRRVRIGDVIDDYCTRCRLIMNHGVAAMVGDDVRKVRCNTCMYEHVYKHGKVPARKRRETEKLFAEVLRGMGREPGDPAAVAEPEPETAPDAKARGAASVDESEAADATVDDGAADETAGDADAAADAGADGDAEAAGDKAAAADGTAPPATEADRPADALHAVRRKLYTIRNFSGGKAPAGGGPTDGSVGGGGPIGGGPTGHGGRRDGAGRHGGGGRRHGGGGRRHGGGQGGRRGR